MTDLAARLLYLLAALFARLPWRLLLRIADVMAAGALSRNAREARVTKRNLELAYPDVLAGERTQQTAAVVHGTTRQLVETLRLWTHAPAANRARIRARHGVERLEAALGEGKGLIVLAPHYGNWELLNQWLAARTPLAILYAPPESAVGEAFLRRVRTAHDDGGRVTQVRAEGAAMRELFRRLREGGVVGILPDQQPKQGDGRFAPFFGQPALTMTLAGRLAARTGGRVLIAYCERIAARAPAFALQVEAAPDAVAGEDIDASVQALNLAVERVARRDPAQYQWTYKRFSIQPDGVPNPYWPDCY